MQLLQSNNLKYKLWADFAAAHKIADRAVPLFEIEGMGVRVIPYGRDGRLVLKRSDEMERLMRGLGCQLIQQHAASKVTHDGILYIMLARDNGHLKPLYIGKAEIFGKSDGNLSSNISDLASGKGKFGRWGYNYAYHIGDLSAVTCDGHSDEKSTNKYKAWREKLFLLRNGQVLPKTDILFWATLWGPNCQSIWQQYGSTTLAFEEYLVIGVASDVFPNSILNQEGRSR